MKNTVTILSDDFLESPFLDYFEKMAFICIKRFEDRQNDVTVSLPTIQKISGISMKKLQEVILSLEDKGALTVITKDKGSLCCQLIEDPQSWGKKQKPTKEEPHPLWQVKDHFDYKKLCMMTSERDANAAIRVLYHVLNAKEDILYIKKTPYPLLQVHNVLLTLTVEQIAASIEKYNHATTPIKNPQAYLLAIMYQDACHGKE